MCLKDINAVIVKFPDSKVLPILDLKLWDILIWMVPTQWWTMLKTMKDPSKMSLQDVIKYFKTLKQVLTSIEKVTFMKPANGNDDDKKKGRKY